MAHEKTLYDLLLYYIEAHYSKGDTIVGATDVQKEMYFIVSGKVVQYDISSSGNKVTINTYGASSFFSLSWLYGSANEHYYEALEDCVVKIIPIYVAKEIFETNRVVYDYYISKLLNGLNGFYKRLAFHMTEDARQRIAYELLLELARFHKDNKLPRKELAIPINALAESTGLTRETVSREISRLTKEGYIEKQGRAIVINSLERLRSLFVI